GTVIDGTNALGKLFSIKEGQAENVLLENGGQLTVVDGTTASGTTIRDSGMQTVKSGGTATGTIIESGGLQTVYAGGKAGDTIINEGGLMQNAGGEDSGTTVKNGGIYEIVFAPYTDYTTRASDLTVEAGGRAEVYAGTLTGATVSGANASLTLMTIIDDKEMNLVFPSLTGQVSVTEGGRLVSQRGADMSGAELTLSSQGGL
ncbi:hypothetical protein F9222_26425, partial [Escherichia coli]